MEPPTTFQGGSSDDPAEDGLLWSIGQGLYSRAACGDTSKATIREFAGKCPPFRAVVYALLLAWFDRSVADRHKRERYQAGRIDLFMAIYLPYCDQFISAEVHGMQAKCLREIAPAANISTEIRSYDDFCNSLLMPQHRGCETETLGVRLT
jgi:hypothetical protein